jgi:hypothetical protein
VAKSGGSESRKVVAMNDLLLLSLQYGRLTEHNCDSFRKSGLAVLARCGNAFLCVLCQLEARRSVLHLSFAGADMGAGNSGRKPARILRLHGSSNT